MKFKVGSLYLGNTLEGKGVAEWMGPPLRIYEITASNPPEIYYKVFFATNKVSVDKNVFNQISDFADQLLLIAFENYRKVIKRIFEV